MGGVCPGDGDADASCAMLAIDAEYTTGGDEGFFRGANLSFAASTQLLLRLGGQNVAISAFQI